MNFQKMKFIETNSQSVHAYTEEEYKVLHLNLLRFPVQYMSSFPETIILGNICIKANNYSYRQFEIRCLINPFEKNSAEYTPLCKDNCQFFKRELIAMVGYKTLPDEEELYLKEFAKSIGYFPRYSMHTIEFDWNEIDCMRFFEIEYNSESGVCNIKVANEYLFKKITFAQQILSETDFKTLITLIVYRTKNIPMNSYFSEINLSYEPDSEEDFDF